MAGRQIELGPAGHNVRANVAQLRKLHGLSYAELSRRLEALGRAIPPLGLRRIEAGERRVDVDDLAALAKALEASDPTELMTFPGALRTLSSEAEDRIVQLYADTVNSQLLSEQAEHAAAIRELNGHIATLQAELNELGKELGKRFGDAP